MKITYHVFSNNCDEWFDDRKEAEKLFKEWADEMGCARLYREAYDDKDEPRLTDCLMSVGEYPQ